MVANGRQWPAGDDIKGFHEMPPKVCEHASGLRLGDPGVCVCVSTVRKSFSTAVLVSEFRPCGEQELSRCIPDRGFSILGQVWLLEPVSTLRRDALQRQVLLASGV